jgi:hypothetical protein
VVTTGIYGRQWKAEASVFNAREPDEARTDFDFGRLDSVSGRFSLAPRDGLSLQVSAGHLKQAEAGAGSLPRTDVDRVTASAIYHRRLREGNVWATTLAYGRNSELSIIPGGSIHQTTHAVLLGLTET